MGRKPRRPNFVDWADYTRMSIGKSRGRMLTVGIGGYFNPFKNVLTQYREVGARGLGACLFSYDQPTGEVSDSLDQLRGYRSPIWEAIGTEIYPDPAPPPVPDWRGPKILHRRLFKGRIGRTARRCGGGPGGHKL